MDDFSLEEYDFEQDPGLENPAAAPAQPAPAAPVRSTGSAAGPNTRMRATPDMITLRYRFKQFLKKGGGELLCIVLFWIGFSALLHGGTLFPHTRGVGPIQTNAIPALISRLFRDGAVLSAVPGIFFSLLTLSAVFFTSRKLGTAETGIAATTAMALFPLFALTGTSVFAVSASFAFTGFSLLLLLKAAENKPGVNSFFSGLLWMTGLTCLPVLLPVSIAVAAGGFSRKKIAGTLPGFLAGTAAGFLLTELLLQTLLGNPALTGVKSILRTAGLNGSAPGSLFPALFTAPALVPFSLLALFALGYTARAGSGSFPTAPAVIFLTAYLFLDLLPVRTGPLRTLAGNGILLSLPLALICGVFIGSLLDRRSLRWLLGALITLTTAALLAAG